MTAPGKLAAFAGGLALLFGGGALAGGAIGPDPEPEPDMAAARASGSGEHAGTPAGEEDHGGGAAAPAPVRGLGIAEGGLRLVVDDPELRRGRAERLAFRIVDERGETVRDFDVEHTKRMHLILARRDLTGFQHLHPEQADDGTWSVRTRLGTAGSYRLFADFTHAGEARTLAGDLRVDGAADLEPLPAARPTAVSDGGYDVRLDAGAPRPGAEAELRFTVTRDGVPVRTEPYLGAGGHLVALREGDLAYLHVHPTEAGHEDEAGADDGHGEDAGAEAHDDAIGFAATFPTAGRYRLFLQFQHEGRVQTVAFTQEVE